MGSAQLGVASERTGGTTLRTPSAAYAASNRSGAECDPGESCSYRVARASKNQDFVILLYASMDMIFLHAGETYES